MKTLTIVISCYNCSKTVKATLDSIPCSGNDDFDVLVINDGSKENIDPIIKPYVNKYPKTIRYIKKENGGHGSCINYGIKHAKSRYIAFLDSDDTYNPVDFKVALRFLKDTKKNTDLVRLNFNMVYVNKNSKKVVHNKVSTTKKRVKYENFKDMSLNGFFTIHSCIYSLELLKKIHPMPEHVSYDDNVLYYEVLLRAKKIAYLNRLIYMYNYFIYGGGKQSISVKNAVKKLNDSIYDYKYALSLPISQFKKNRDRVVRKCFNLMLGWVIFTIGYDDSKSKIEKGALAKEMFALYDDFMDRNPSRNIKPAVYKACAHSTYGQTDKIKTWSKIVRITFMTAAMHKPKKKKSNKNKKN